jgi:hypothetical protein
VVKRARDFYFVRVSEKKAAQDMKASRSPEVVFLDPDGDEIFRSNFDGGRSLEKAMAEALRKYAPREIAWSAYEAKKSPIDESKRPVLLGFFDEKKESLEELKSLEDRTIAKLHDRFHFVRAAFRRDSEEAKKYEVFQAPSFVILEPAKGEVVEKAVGKKSVRDLKAILAKALAKLEKK